MGYFNKAVGLYAWAVRDGDVTPYFCQGNFDFDSDVDGTDAALFKTHFGRSPFKNPCPPDGPAPVEKTWQTTCYDSGGYVIPCWVGTGQDGEFQKGVAWPNPRFTDNGDNTVTDHLTGLMWTRNGNHFITPKLWQEALDWIDTMNAGVSFGYNDWRLPNYKELFSLIDASNQDPALPTGHLFINVQSNYYWSSTTYALGTDYAWGVSMYSGMVDYGLDKTSGYYVWPVRGGH